MAAVLRKEGEGEEGEGWWWKVWSCGEEGEGGRCGIWLLYVSVVLWVSVCFWLVRWLVGEILYMGVVLGGREDLTYSWVGFEEES